MFSFITMAERSPVKSAMRFKAASQRDLTEAEYHGVMNTAYKDPVANGGKDFVDGTWFVVQNPEYIKKNQDYVDELEKSPWYYGHISRERAEEILNDNVSAGTFLVWSGLKETEFYISVRSPEGEPKVRHIEVDRYEDKFVVVLGNSEDAMGFATFEKLVEYLRVNPIHFDGCENDFPLTDCVDKLGMTVF